MSTVGPTNFGCFNVSLIDLWVDLILKQHPPPPPPPPPRQAKTDTNAIEDNINKQDEI